MESKHLKKTAKKKRSVFSVVVLDILLVGIVLCTFAFFHHVLPVIRARMDRAQTVTENVRETAVPTAAPAATAEPEPTPETVSQGTTAQSAPETTPEPTPEPTPDLRTEWQIKFADKFTDEVVRTENSYSSPNVSITIDTVVTGEGSSRITYYVADVYVASIENFRTYTANNELKYYSTQDVIEMDLAADALVSISGDFYAYQATGFLMRNGQIYRTDYTYCSICVMYYDGTIECYPRNSYNIDEILARNPYQIWNFGPTLLDENGKAATSFPEVNTTIKYVNPRSAIGYYEPGHYCLVVVDGRQEGYSKGMTLPELGKVFEDLGCTTAYNLDGGGSAVMTFNHERYSQASNGAGRKLSDIILVCETAAADPAGQAGG